MTPLSCPYCGQKAKLELGSRVYPRSVHVPRIALRQFWVCWPCDARVGLHDDGRPLGTLANRDLRRWRTMVHRVLDPIWLAHRDKGKARRRVYLQLAHALGIDIDHCHVGWFDVDQCRRALDALDAMKRGAEDVRS